MTIDEAQLKIAVRKVLDKGKWPEYKTQDDNGLADYEYVKFIQDVLKEIK